MALNFGYVVECGLGFTIAEGMVCGFYAIANEEMFRGQNFGRNSEGGKSHGNEQTFYRIGAVVVHDVFRADPSRLPYCRSALNHPSHKRIEHQYCNGLG